MIKKILFSLGLISLISCDSELKETDTNQVFDSSNLLASVVENHIIPEYESFSNDLIKLENATEVYVNEINLVNLTQLRQAHLQTYKSFQPIAKYDFGLALDINLYQNLNLHPFNTTNIASFIQNQETVDLGSILNQDRQGFPAIDYMLNGLADSDEEILSFYTGENGAAYRTFLTRLVERVVSLTTSVNQDWISGYGDRFVAENGSLTVFVNAYIQYFEKRLRSSKIDFPAGKFDGTPSPEVIESLYAPEASRDLLMIALESSEILYRGASSAEVSLSSVLVDLGKEGLDAQIKLRFLEAKNFILTLDTNLFQQVEIDNSKMLDARDKLQEIVRLLKIDLVSALNIAITFQDNDGD